MLFDDITCNVITKDDVVIASGHKRGNLYVLEGTADRQSEKALVAARSSSDLWHQRLAHVNDKEIHGDFCGLFHEILCSVLYGPQKRHAGDVPGIPCESDRRKWRSNRCAENRWGRRVQKP